MELPNCNSKVDFEICSNTQRNTKRSIPTTTMVVTFEVPLVVQGEFDLEEYFATRNS